MKDIVFSTVTICLLLVILVLILLSPSGGTPQSPVLPEQMRTLAAALESQGLYKQAVDQYASYLEVAQAPAEQRANILYRMGTIYLDQLSDYENALASFLRISHLYPKAAIVRDAEKRMVRCFEELQRGGAAQRKLKQLTDLDPDQEPQGAGPVVAQIGDRKITLDQLESELNQMPDMQRKQYEAPDKKREYLKSKLFEELLYDMALRKEYNKDREVRQQVQRIEKMILAQKVLQEEVTQKIQVSQGDLDLYYKANPDEFKIPLSLRISHIQTADEEKANQAKKALDEGLSFAEAVNKFSEDERTKARGGSLGAIYQGGQSISGIGSVPEIIQQLITLNKDDVTTPIKSDKGFHIFKITEKTPERQMPFDEVKSQVEARLKQRKASELQTELLQRLLKAEKVKIFDQSLIDQQQTQSSSN